MRDLNTAIIAWAACLGVLAAAASPAAAAAPAPASAAQPASAKPAPAKAAAQARGKAPAAAGPAKPAAKAGPAKPRKPKAPREARAPVAGFAPLPTEPFPPLSFAQAPPDLQVPPPASEAVMRFVAWVVGARDNRGRPFAVIDKAEAAVFVYGSDGLLAGAAPALLGFAFGDDTVPGIGDRELSTIRPEERTTPAGRFIAALGPDNLGQEVLWVDYDAAVSLHPVITTNPAEHRPQRLATPTPLDNRITFGCINVPADFYEGVVRPLFTGVEGVVYVLPETRALEETFPEFRVERVKARKARRPPRRPVPVEAPAPPPPERPSWFEQAFPPDDRFPDPMQSGVTRPPGSKAPPSD